MIYIKTIFFFVSLLTVRGNVSPVNGIVDIGLVKITCIQEQPGRPKPIVIIPTDTIYYNGSIGVELNSARHTVEVNSTMSQEVIRTGYHLLDLKKFNYFKFKSIEELDPGKVNWEPIQKKMVGMKLTFPYYVGQKYTVSDTVINDKKLQLVHYIFSGESMEAAPTKIIIDPDKSCPVPLKSISEKFKGRVLALIFDYPINQAVTTIQFDYEDNIEPTSEVKNIFQKIGALL